MIIMKNTSCPVCSYILPVDGICLQCGYDRSCDYEQNPTFCPILVPMLSQAKLRVQWEQEQSRIRAEEEDKVLSDQLKEELAQERARRVDAEIQLKHLQQLTQRNSELESAGALQNKESASLRTKLKEQEKSISTLRTELSALQATVDQYAFDIKRVQSRRKELEKENSTLQSSLNQCKRELEQEKKHSTETINQYKRDLGLEKNQNAKNSNQYKRDLELEKQRYEKTVEAYEAQRIALEATIDQHKRKLAGKNKEDGAGAGIFVALILLSIVFFAVFGWSVFR